MNLSGGKTRDGGNMVGGSVFYAAEAKETSNEEKPEPTDVVEHLEKELQESEQKRIEAEKLEQQLSSLVWICTSTQKMSKVTVIDANNPAEILDIFNVCQSHLLCIASVPGAKDSDYVKNARNSHYEQTVEAEVHGPNEDMKKDVEKADKSEAVNGKENSEAVEPEKANLGKVVFVKVPFETQNSSEEEENAEPELLEKMSSVQPTMWLGAQDGSVFIHSAVAKWSVCLQSIKLKDAVLSIVYVKMCFQK